MSVRKVCRTDGAKDREFYLVDVDIEMPSGERVRERKVSPVQTLRGAQAYERDLREAILDGSHGKEVPTFKQWFDGRFWNEWVLGHRNKQSEQESKKGIFGYWLEPAFGELRLDEIDASRVSTFRAKLSTTKIRGNKEMSGKRANNILTVLSKALRFAVEVGVIDQAPKITLFRVERPEIKFFTVENYVRVLAAAKAYSAMWYAAVCLAGEAGLRVGEVKALRWREDVDLVARTITVNQQRRHGVVGTPKGRTRRSIPMTPTLFEALRALDVVRTGNVIRTAEGGEVTDEQAKWALESIYRKAGLPSSEWHILRHSFGTHAALFGVNPWRLQAWLGHKRIDETMLYVHVAEIHERSIPDEVLAAGASERDPDRRILAMLGARAYGHLTATKTEGAATTGNH